VKTGIEAGEGALWQQSPSVYKETLVLLAIFCLLAVFERFSVTHLQDLQHADINILVNVCERKLRYKRRRSAPFSKSVGIFFFLCEEFQINIISGHYYYYHITRVQSTKCSKNGHENVAL